MITKLDRKPWRMGQSMSAHLGEPKCTDFLLALMPLKAGERAGVTIFMAADKDWSDYHFLRHGGQWLATLPATMAVADFRDCWCTRAYRLNYSRSLLGMVEDLSDWDYTSEQIATFLKAAEPHMP